MSLDSSLFSICFCKALNALSLFLKPGEVGFSTKLLDLFGKLSELDEFSFVFATICSRSVLGLFEGWWWVNCNASSLSSVVLSSRIFTPAGCFVLNENCPWVFCWHWSSPAQRFWLSLELFQCYMFTKGRVGRNCGLDPWWLADWGLWTRNQ